MTSDPTQAEMTFAREWLEKSFGREGTEGGGAPEFPFSFRVGEGAEPAPLTEWRREWRDGELVLSDPSSGIECRAELVRFDDAPVAEWVLHFRNTGDAPSPAIIDLQPLDARFAVKERALLRHAKGSECRADDFAPLETEVKPGAEVRIGSKGGRSSDGALPFFNLDLGGRGVVGAVGWSGNWAARFAREGDSVCARAGMQATRISLRPGEEMRTPRIAILFWDGEPARAQNMLRRFLLAHHVPQAGGKPVTVPMAFPTWGEELCERHVKNVRWLAGERTGVEDYWIDAGWHGEAPFREGANVFNSDWWRHVGDWRPNPNTYPEGLAPVGAACRENGMGFILWVEPERVFKDTPFARERAGWLLGPVGDNFLFDLGNPDARRGLTEVLSKLISEGGLTVLRQDFNTEPEHFWCAADEPDCLGIHEIRHVEGLYAMWDELLARHPGLMIDDCASGGRRIDLETISRSVPFWRSDYQCTPGFNPTSMQAQAVGLLPWVPLSAGVVDRVDTYAFRSALSPGVLTPVGASEPVDAEGAVTPGKASVAEWLRVRIAEAKRLRPYFYGDFHPLVSFDLAEDTWAAWQVDRPDLGEGAVIAFRRPESPFPAMEARLKGLDPGATYEVVELPEGGGEDRPVARATGAELGTKGLLFEIPERRSSRVLVYRRAKV